MSVETPENLQSASAAGQPQAHNDAGDASPTSPSRHFGRMDSAETRRRLVHILPGFLPLVLWRMFHHDPLSWDARLILACVIGGIALATEIKYRRIARRGETHNRACILGYAVPVFSLLVLVPAHAELGFAALAIIALGDGMATVGGMLLKSPPLPWNRDKSWSGFLCFVVFSAPWSTVIYWGEARPVVDFGKAFLLCSSVTLVAAIAESVRSRIDDNIRVGVSVFVGLLLAQSVIFGW
jgi:dolichol kinase